MNKKITVILLIILAVIVPTKALAYEDESIANNYDNFLKSSKNRRISKEAMKHMWHSFWDYIGVYKNDDNNINFNRNSSSRSNKNNSSFNSSTNGNSISTNNSFVVSLAENNSGDIYYTNSSDELKMFKNNKTTVIKISNDLKYKKVVYDKLTDDVYVYCTNNNTGYIYQVYPNTKMITNKIDKDLSSNDFIIKTGPDCNFYYCNGKRSLVGFVSKDKNTSKNFKTLKGNSSVVVRDNDIFILNGGNKKLYKIKKSPYTLLKETTYNTKISSSCSYNNNFYAALGNEIYVLNLNGKITRKIRIRTGEISSVGVGKNNSLIVSFKDNNKIKRIEL